MEPIELPRYDATVEHSKLLGEAVSYVGRNRQSITAAALKKNPTANAILDRFYEFASGDYQPRRIAEFIRLVCKWETES